MSPDILPGLAAGASTPPGRTGPAATGPPNDAGLSALFASLLTQSGGPKTKAGVIPGVPPDSLAAKMNSKAEPGKQAVPAPLSKLTLPLPIKAGSTRPIQQDPMKPLPPPIAGVAAETQNAMDTVPVSGFRKAKASETKPGGELPLPEARTIPSAALPVPPILFIVRTLPTAVIPPVSVVAASGPPAAVPPTAAAVKGEAPFTVGAAYVSIPPSVGLPITALSSALPKTWTLPALSAPERPMPAADLKPAAVAADAPSETGTTLALLPPKPAAEMPYTVTRQVLTVPVQAVGDAAAEPAPDVKAGDISAPLSGLKPRSEKAPTPFLPAPKGADAAAKVPEGLNAPRPTMSVADPTLISAAAPQTVMAAVPVRQSLPHVVDVQPADGAAESSVSSTFGPQAQTSKISLKSLAVSADNNTRTRPVTTNKPGLQRLTLEGATKSAERPVTKIGNGSQELQEALASAPAQVPTASVQTVSAAPTPLTRTDRAEVVRQVADAVGAMPPPPKPGAASQMTLQLHPRDWGQLQISVRIAPAVQGGVTQAQTVTAHVVAASPQIKAVLESGSGDLRHALRQAGLHLDKLTVTVQAPEASAKSGMTPGGHHLMNGGSGGQTQPDGRPSGNGPQPGMASFASFTGSPQGGRQDGPPSPSQAGGGTSETVEEPVIVRDSSRRVASGQVDMRA